MITREYYDDQTISFHTKHKEIFCNVKSGTKSKKSNKVK